MSIFDRFRGRPPKAQENLPKNSTTKISVDTERRQQETREKSEFQAQFRVFRKRIEETSVYPKKLKEVVAELKQYFESNFSGFINDRYVSPFLSTCDEIIQGKGALGAQPQGFLKEMYNAAERIRLLKTGKAEDFFYPPYGPFSQLP